MPRTCRDGTLFGDPHPVKPLSNQATFACNATPLPANLPPGLTEEFWGDRRAVQWWNAFWKKAVNTEPIRPFEEVVRFSAAFLWPPATAARGEAFNAEWPAGGPWTSAKP